MVLNKFNTGKQTLTFLLLPLVVGCTTGTLFDATKVTPASPVASGVPTSVQDQLNEASDLTLNSALNSLNQARIAFANLSGRVNNVTAVDSEAFQEVPVKLLAPLVLVANALNSRSDLSLGQPQQLVQDFKQVYFDSLQQMQQGINGNLRTYQNNLESPQTLFANSPDGSTDTFNDQALLTLANLFEAQEITEKFVTELAQFTNLLTASDTQTTLTAIQQQQTIVINGVLNFTSQGASQNAIVQAYNTVAKSLTSANLISQLQQLAIKAFTADKVAFKQSEVTPTQPNPNQSELVIQEGESTYRKIAIINGTLSNQIINDTRGLSAADLLNSTTAIKVTGSN